MSAPSLPAPARLPQLTAAIELVSEISKQLTERKNEAVSEINSSFAELERTLQLRKMALVTDLESMCSTKQKVSPMVPSHNAPVLTSPNLTTGVILHS